MSRVVVVVPRDLYESLYSELECGQRKPDAAPGKVAKLAAVSGALVAAVEAADKSDAKVMRVEVERAQLDALAFGLKRIVYTGAFRHGRRDDKQQRLARALYEKIEAEWGRSAVEVLADLSSEAPREIA